MILIKMRSMNKLLLLVICFTITTVLSAQKEVNVSQYMLSRYAVNTAFGGSHEALSILGSYRQKWMGFNGTPTSLFFAAHAPLKKDAVALGLEFYNQSYNVVNESGFAGSYTYRVRTGNNIWLGFSLSGGLSFTSVNWGGVPLKETGDPVFVNEEKKSVPILGFGTAIYGESFFAGVSVPNFYYNDITTSEKASIDPGKAQFLLTGGYMFRLSDMFKVQPSALVIINRKEGNIIDASGSVIWNDMLWIGLTYRTIEEIVGMAAFQVLPQFRVAYSFDYNTGQLKNYNNGTHEFSLQYKFGYKVNTPSPKFF